MNDANFQLLSLCYTWDITTFVTGTKLEFANQPVLHIILVDIWSTIWLANSDFVLTTNALLSHVLCQSIIFRDIFGPGDPLGSHTYWFWKSGLSSK